MELINESMFPAAWMVGKIQPPQWSMTCLVKGTFQLKSGQIIELAEEQADLTGDMHVDNDINKLLRYPSDFVYYKPKADLIVIGTCYAPNSGTTSVLPVRFRVGEAYEKVLMVVGDRMINDRGDFTEPKPFQKIPLTFQNAYGGSGYDKNPLGKGMTPVAVNNGLNIYVMPNIVYPQNSDGANRSDPACLGPINQTWPQRVTKMGTYDDIWLKQRWPWFPADCNWGFFNASPEDQQLAGYLRGNEDLFFENLHPSQAQYRCKLPGIRIRCFIEERVRAHINFREVPMQLDTLWIDMDQERLNLVWRGIVPVQTEKLEEILHLFVMAEAVNEPTKPLDYYRNALVTALIKREEEDEELDEEEDEEDEEVSDEDESEKDETEEDLEVSPETEKLPLVVPGAIQPSAAVDQAVAHQSNQAKNLVLEETTEKISSEPEGMLEDEIDEELAEDSDEELTLEQLMERIRRKESLEGAELSSLDLNGVDLSHMNLRNAIFDEVILYKANLAYADLTGATLAGLNLQEANCEGANFSEADLSEAKLCGANLSHAVLQETDLMKADLRHANLEKVKAQGVDFSEADLSDATLVGASLISADLTDCKLHRTNLSRADLTEASLQRAWGRHIQLEGAKVDVLKAAGANFCEGNFKYISGKETVWEGGEYYGADFSGANLPGAEFSTAYLGWAKFNATDLTEAVFDEACLVSAEMVRTKLLNASIQKADLTQVNLFESNLYEANLCFSNVTGTNLERANLRMLKHTMDR